MMLMMCTYAQELCRYAAAYVSIIGLARWYEKKLRVQPGYAKDILSCMGDKTPELIIRTE